MTSSRASIFERALRQGKSDLEALREAIECPYPWQGGDSTVVQDSDELADESVPFDSPLVKGAQVAVAWQGVWAEPLPDASPAPDITRWCELAEGGTARPEWWSLPLAPQVLVTTRSVAVASVGLIAMEDDLGRTRADLFSVEVPGGYRVYEIDSIDAWRNLVQRFPMDVTRSRAGTWGGQRRWQLPDWRAVAEEFELVHLSVAAYLRAAGEPLKLDDGYTMLAGWGPDECLWLREGSITPRSRRTVSLEGGAWRTAT